MTAPVHTLAACISWGATHEISNRRTEAGRLKSLCEWRGVTMADLAQMAASVPLYLEKIAPKFDATDEDLVRDLEGKYSFDTYQQYQRAGCRLIKHFTGEYDAAAERKARNDEWSPLISLLWDLASAGLVSKASIATVEQLADICRRINLGPRDLEPDRIPDLRAVILHTTEWPKVLKALRFLDRSRIHPCLLVLLPDAPFGRIDDSWRRVFILPPKISEMVEAWASRASREKVADERFEKYAEPLSAKTFSHRRTVLRNYVSTADEAGAVSLAEVCDLAELFEPAVIDATIEHWVETSSAPGGLTFRSISDYCDELLVILSRNGLADEADYLDGLRCAHRHIKAGRRESSIMAAKNQTWCQTLLASDEKVEVFETQHVLYWKTAKEALAEADAAGLNLRDLVTPKSLARLPKKKRVLAGKLIAKARKFGVCAAFAAIELEAAPFRKTNTLDLAWKGPTPTFFDHSSSADPHFTIIIPNELLKNGKSLTKRGEQLPPIEIRDKVPSDHGFKILRWYIDEIRPLFAGARHSSRLFPSCLAGSGRLSDTAMDLWLFQCSTAIGLPLTPHNFRHGYVSIQYEADRSCLGDLAIIMAISESTLRRHYRFIDRIRTVREVQDKFRHLRQARREAWHPILLRASA
jgi:hypothetical protein